MYNIKKKKKIPDTKDTNKDTNTWYQFKVPSEPV
tara:strand:- start:315 stop:416 length:102 start_codon:yes stop_codon:yes gene_type:complete